MGKNMATTGGDGFTRLIMASISQYSQPAIHRVTPEYGDPDTPERQEECRESWRSQHWRETPEKQEGAELGLREEDGVQLEAG